MYFAMIYKKLYKNWFILIVAPFLLSLSVNGQSFNWVKTAGGTGHDIGTKVCMDGNGTIYATANAGGGGNFVTFLNDTFNINGLGDIFLTKYDLSGNELWTKQFGGNNIGTNPYYGEGFSALLFDSLNNCLYLAGQFYGTITFDSISLIAGSGGTDDFIAKFDLNGNCQWAKHISSVGSHRAPVLALDQVGNIYAMGALSDSGSINVALIVPGIYLAKMNASGNLLSISKVGDWNWQYNSPSFVYGEMCYSRDRLYILGACFDTLTIDTIHLSSVNSQYSQVLTTWDTLGRIIWARNSIDANTFDGTFEVDLDGNSYIMNSFQAPWIRFDNDTVFSDGNTGGYIMKYDVNGNLVWINSIEVGQPFSPKCSAINEDNNLLFAGRFRDSLILDGFVLSASSSYSLFVASYDTSGLCTGTRQVKWAESIDIIYSSGSSIYLTGGFSNSTNFGSISQSSYGSSDIFLANLNAITGLGGGERMIQDQLVIYANPNKGSFRVQVPEQLSDLRGAWLFVYDVQGKEVARFNLDKMNETPQLEINNANAGFYTVRLVKDKKVFTGKMVVE